MVVRRVLVTGANKGIGLAVAARCLADYNDVEVVMACRSLERGVGARDALVAGNPGWADRVEVLELDTSSDASVRKAAETFKNSERSLYAIVNNAGIAAGSIEDILNVNVRGPKRVDDSFLPFLDAASGRIVNMSSGAASGCVSKSSQERQKQFTDTSITWAEIESVMDEVEAFPNGMGDFASHGIAANLGCYGLSKALLCSYTMHIARDHPHLKVNSCSPGMINTDIINSFLPWWAPVPTSVVRFLARNFIGAKTPDEGTVSTMHLLFSDDFEGNGRYYGSDAQRSPLDKPRSPGSPPYEGL